MSDAIKIATIQFRMEQLAKNGVLTLLSNCTILQKPLEWKICLIVIKNFIQIKYFLALSVGQEEPSVVDYSLSKE